MKYWGLLALLRRNIARRAQSACAKVGENRRILLKVCLVAVLLMAGAGQVAADSPPNPTANIPWNTGSSGVADVEAAYNHGRREEEKQLGLAEGTLGNLDLPSQVVWDATSDDVKALTIMNAERVARAGMKPGVIGLPFQAVQADVDSLAQWYADYLVANNKKGHTADGRDPFQRIDQDPVLGPCHEFLTRAENLGYAVSTNTFPLFLERMIYHWIYDDDRSGANWGHREAVLLQDKPLGGVAADGFKNNVGSSASEGFIGIGIIKRSPGYDPFGSGYPYGWALVMNMIDPSPTCSWDLGPTVTGITPNSGGNSGWLTITNLAGTGFQDGATVKLQKSGQPDIVASSVKWINDNKIVCSLNLTGVAPGTWDVVVTNPDTKSGKLASGFTVTGAAAGPTISSITPNAGSNTGPIQITDLAGSGFQAGATVKLSRGGDPPDIVATSVQVVNASKITCVFDLSVAPGVYTWDVVVTNPDSKSATLPNAFRITKPDPSRPYSAYLPTILRPRAGETTVNLGAMIDTTVLSGDPSGFFGSEASMWTGYDSAQCFGYKESRSLVAFDPSSIPQGATIVKATLHVEQNFACHYAPADRIITAYRIAGWWDPNAVTWNTQPNQGASYGQMTVRSGQFQRHSMDVTDLVRGWVKGTFANWGLMLRGPENTGGEPTVIGFATRQYEQGQYAAVLEVTYQSSSSAPVEDTVQGGFGPEAEAAPKGGGGQGLLPRGVR